MRGILEEHPFVDLDLRLAEGVWLAR